MSGRVRVITYSLNFCVARKTRGHHGLPLSVYIVDSGQETMQERARIDFVATSRKGALHCTFDCPAGLSQPDVSAMPSKMYAIYRGGASR